MCDSGDAVLGFVPLVGRVAVVGDFVLVETDGEGVGIVVKHAVEQIARRFTEIAVVVACVLHFGERDIIEQIVIIGLILAYQFIAVLEHSGRVRQQGGFAFPILVAIDSHEVIAKSSFPFFTHYYHTHCDKAAAGEKFKEAV